MQATLTFDRFIPISGSHRAFDTAMAFAECRPTAPRVLLMTGRPGVGKTHLLRAIAGASTGYGVIMTTAGQLADLLISAIRSNSIGVLQRRYTAGDLLLVEDLHTLSTRTATQGELARQMNNWIDAGARVAMTAGTPVHKLSALVRGFPAAPASRVVLLRRPSRRDMELIVRRLARRANVHLDRDSAHDITAWSTGDVRRAVGAMQQLQFERLFEERLNQARC